jgi:transcription-repair coupling factor (superfamily II helicase)
VEEPEGTRGREREGSGGGADARACGARAHARHPYPADTPWQTEFEDEFPYEETEDQLAALAEIKRDMQSKRPMDRLVCGDVGFGKTELAIRAAFKACEFGKQVAVLVPTTVLAEQHERTFKSRFAGYPFRVESPVTIQDERSRTPTRSSRCVRKGQVDVIIGTHRLLSKDVRFGTWASSSSTRSSASASSTRSACCACADGRRADALGDAHPAHAPHGDAGIRDISSLATPPRIAARS